MTDEWTISPAGKALGDVVGVLLSEEPLTPEQVALVREAWHGPLALSKYTVCINNAITLHFYPYGAAADGPMPAKEPWGEGGCFEPTVQHDVSVPLREISAEQRHNMTVVLSDLLRSWEGVLREARTGRLEGAALEMQRSELIADAVTQCGWFARGL